ncbi:hypothetical protein B0H12DRAFT_238948 [Mycena haematopus]|nr:hypothetical protein B0H12DRAFT_238948 [Mycena haematopus]
MAQTPHEDTNHALKCLRVLATRDGGVDVFGFQITAPIIEDHLRQNSFTTSTIESLLSPNDMQDVLVVNALLKALRELPDAPRDSTPAFCCAREALKTFGSQGVQGRG